MSPEQQLLSWPAEAAAGWTSQGKEEFAGRRDRVWPWASVTKIVTSLAAWVAVEEGIVAWEDPVGPSGSSLAHLLAHASGLAPDSDEVIAPPGQRRIYSNRGIDLAAAHVARSAGLPFAEYVTEGVLAPLGLHHTRWGGSPAAGASGPVADLLALGRELLAPSLVHRSTLQKVTTVAFPGLSGVLPGFGRQENNDWGLGVEIRDQKHPHWTGSRNSPETFGHFGQSGAFLWVDPIRKVAAASVAGRPFGAWAASAWPPFSDAVLDDLDGG